MSKPLRCDVCGQFVAHDTMYRALTTPDSVFTGEQWETLCEWHALEEGKGPHPVARLLAEFAMQYSEPIPEEPK